MHNLECLPKKPIELSEEMLQHYTGEYGWQKVTTQDGKLYLNNDQIMPIAQDTFTLKDNLEVRLQLARNDTGDPIQIILHVLNDNIEFPRNLSLSPPVIAHP